MCNRNPLHCIVPPKLLERLLQSTDPEVREAAMNTIVSTARLRGQRELLAQTFAPLSGGGLHRSIMNADHAFNPTGRIVRSEGNPPVEDADVNNVYDGFGATYELYSNAFRRDSIDGKGLPIEGVVHYGDGYNNAFWNGRQMIFGDGDGKAFIGFTQSLDVIGHELTHGVTEFSCNLEYHNQSGALNESMSDVFGSLVKQYKMKQTADQADWLIGAGILGPALKGKALRSMKAPGTAFEGDDQPANMSKYQDLPDTDSGDFGGVHTNSGIPNHAFYLAATAIGGNAWEAAGTIWYNTLLSLQPTSDFGACATTCYHVAGREFGQGSSQQKAVLDAWNAVGVQVNTTGITLATELPNASAYISALDRASGRI